MPDPVILIQELRTFLVAQGVVRLAETPPSDGALPPCWLDPRDGAPQPAKGGTDLAAVTLKATGQIPGDWHEGFLEERVIDIVVRATTSPRGEMIQRQIRGLLDDKKEYFVGSLRVEWSKLWRGTQPIGSDERTYDTAQAFRIACRTKSLAGLPYA